MSKISSKERKKYLIRGSILIVLGLVLFGINYFTNNNVEEKSITSAEKFKTEYESFNGKSNKNGKNYISVNIDKDNPIKYVTGKQAVKVIKEGSGIIYFGFPECPWCRNVVPILLDSAKTKSINQIYYFNPINDRDTKELNEDGTIKTTKEGSKEYAELIKLLDNYLPVYTGLNDDSIKRLYVPLIVFVQNGKIVDTHMGTIDSQTDPYVLLNDTEKNELKNVFINSIDKVYNIDCVGEC